MLFLFQYVPLVVEACIQIVEEKGLDNQGLYRVPGNTGAVNQLQEELNKVCEYIEKEYDDGLMCHCHQSVNPKIFTVSIASYMNQ